MPGQPVQYPTQLFFIPTPVEPPLGWVINPVYDNNSRVTVNKPYTIDTDSDIIVRQGPSVSGGGGGGGSGSGSTYRVDAPAATWIIQHNLGRIPTVDVYLSNGEKVIADVVCTDQIVSVIFAQATTGIVAVA